MNITRINSILIVCLLLAILSPVFSQAEDTDGDGWTDADELSAGSSPHDRGSMPQSLRSPVYTLWNGFLDIQNILELVNTSDKSAFVDVYLYRIDGSLGTRERVIVPGKGQFDVLVNLLPGFSANSYGVIKIEFDKEVMGQLMYYSSKVIPTNFYGAWQKYQFGFPLHLSNPLYGESSVLFNTYALSEVDRFSGDILSTPVEAANWLSLVNLSSQIQSYTIDSYDQSGALLLRQEVTLGSFERRDLDGGHGLLGQGFVGSHRIRPNNPNAPYLSYNARYHYHWIDNEIIAAYAVPAKAGTSSVHGLETSIGSARFGFIEILNTTDTSIEVVIDVANAQPFREDDPCGEEHNERHTIGPNAQIHIDRESFERNGCDSNIIIVRPQHGGSVITQLAGYHYLKSDVLGIWRFEALILRAAREPIGRNISVSYNTFLSMDNVITLARIDDEDTIVRGTVKFSTPNGEQKDLWFEIGPRKVTPYISLNFDATGDYTGKADRTDQDFGEGYGLVEIELDTPGKVIPFGYRFAKQLQFHASEQDVDTDLPAFIFDTNILSR